MRARIVSKASRYSVGELRIATFLRRLFVKFEREVSFPDCVDKGRLTFDFYLPKFDLIIEYDGRQHYTPIQHFGGLVKLRNIARKDKIKNAYCRDKGVHLLRIKYLDYDNIEVMLIRALRERKMCRKVFVTPK